MTPGFSLSSLALTAVAGAALDVGDVAAPWAAGVRTRIQPGLFEHISTATNRPASP